MHNSFEIAEKSGRSLERIEDIVNHLIKLIDSISIHTKHQSDSHTHISRTINNLKKQSSTIEKNSNNIIKDSDDISNFITEIDKSLFIFKID